MEPWDDVAGFRAFGFDNTRVSLLNLLISQPIRVVVIEVANHRKIFSPTFMYWDDGQNELFRDTTGGLLNLIIH